MFTPAPGNKYVLPIQKEDKESGVQPSGSVPVEKGPNHTQLCCSKRIMIACADFNIDERSFEYALKIMMKVCLN